MISTALVFFFALHSPNKMQYIDCKQPAFDASAQRGCVMAKMIWND